MVAQREGSYPGSSLAMQGEGHGPAQTHPMGLGILAAVRPAVLPLLPRTQIPQLGQIPADQIPRLWGLHLATKPEVEHPYTRSACHYKVLTKRKSGQSLSG